MEHHMAVLKTTDSRDFCNAVSARELFDTDGMLWVPWTSRVRLFDAAH